MDESYGSMYCENEHTNRIELHKLNLASWTTSIEILKLKVDFIPVGTQRDIWALLQYKEFFSGVDSHYKGKTIIR